MKLIMGAIVALLGVSTIYAAEPAVIASGMKMPESVALDKKRHRLYVSNINGGIAEQDENGSISIIQLDDRTLIPDWITGLHSPKGLALHGDLLYIADVGQVVIANVTLGKVVATYHLPSSKVLNGITVDPRNGAIYVSDWLGGAIYRLADYEIRAWIEPDTLPAPNGVQVIDNYLYVAMWGSEPGGDFTTKSSGYLSRFDLTTKKEQQIPSSISWINPDGLHVIWEPRKRILTTDFMRGVLIDIDPLQGSFTEYPLAYGAADFAYNEETGVAYVPMMMNGQVVSVDLNRGHE